MQYVEIIYKRRDMTAENQTKWKSFKEVAKINLKTERGGDFQILLKMNDARIYKMEYYFEGELLKPKLLHGTRIAYAKWNKLLEKFNLEIGDKK